MKDWEKDYYADLLAENDKVCCPCPGCGENRVDWLAWTDDGDHVECLTCGAWYDPDEED